MEAKDTVDVKLGRVLDEECGLAFPAEYYDAVDPEDFRKVYKAGIREVVEWLRQENDKHPQVLDGSFIIAKLNQERWQAKLKEWGIEAIK